MKTHNNEKVRSIAEISRSPVKLFLCIVVSMVFAAVPVMALTPDGQTSAKETVCDNQPGEAFGLCNAYCEAMDCDSDNTKASDKACEKVKEKFNSLTGSDPPCDAKGKGDECFDANEFAGTQLTAFQGECKDQAGCPYLDICVTYPSCYKCATGAIGGGNECDLCNYLLEVFGKCDNVCK